MLDLNKYRIEMLPNTAYYVPNFITCEEESDLMKMIYDSPKPKWKTLTNRRLQNWGGLPHPKGMIQEKLPKWLIEPIKKVHGLRIFQNYEPNHVLINEYLPGQGIMPHEDGPLFYPTIATINLGSHTVLDYYQKSFETELEPISDKHTTNDDVNQNANITDKYAGSLLLERCSLLVVQNDLYTNYLHGIDERCADVISDSIKNLHLCNIESTTSLSRNTRISLTIRYVPHTLKANFIFGIR